MISALVHRSKPNDAKRDPCIERTMNTIEIMENTSLAVDATHLHSFQRVSGSFLLGFLTIKCSICDGRIRQFFGSRNQTIHSSYKVGSDMDAYHNNDLKTSASNDVVRCVACGIYVHRDCLFSLRSRGMKGDHDGLEKCKVNQDLIEKSRNHRNQMEQLFVAEVSDDTIENDLLPAEKYGSSSISQPRNTTESLSVLDESLNTDFKLTKERRNDDKIHLDHQLSSNSDTTSQDSSVLDTGGVEPSFFFESNNTWTVSGPPSHWALEHPESLNGIDIIENEHKRSEITESSKTSELNRNNPIRFLGDSFALFSQVLQDNLHACYKRIEIIERTKRVKSPQTSNTLDKSESNDDNDETTPKNLSDTSSSSSPSSSPSSSSTSSKPIQSSLINSKVIYNILHTITSSRSKLNAASIAGGIAGGVAGLCFAGPAGAYLGLRVGQTCGVLGVITGGTLNVGVFAFSAAAGVKAQQAVIKNNNVRMLSIGEEGMKRKMMLVRPNIHVSSHWETKCFELRKEWHNLNSKTLLETLRTGDFNEHSKRRDEDILSMEESEINLKEKVLLLASRSLNNKQSAPGHVYRELINTFRQRLEHEKETLGTLCLDPKNESEKKEKKHFSRNRRQDAHGVIKYTTVTLLDVRPGLGQNMALTEMSVIAVERLVFGEVYNEVFEEMVHESMEKDTLLMKRIQEFHDGDNGKNNDQNDDHMLSTRALEVLHMVGTAHSPADKLTLLVEFLEITSANFSAICKKSSSQPSSVVGADTLLKLVCQHIIAAKIPQMNAEMLFLEEFTRDEQLLKGKEGYALVTLQAALHFLNCSKDLEHDIFDNFGRSSKQTSTNR